MSKRMDWDTEAVISKFKCPKCGGNVRVHDTMFMKMWECVESDCDYECDDW